MKDEWLQANGGGRSWRLGLLHLQGQPGAHAVLDPNIHAVLEELLGEPAGVHLSLTGWLTTTRDWHQDCVLNPQVSADGTSRCGWRCRPVATGRSSSSTVRTPVAPLSLGQEYARL